MTQDTVEIQIGGRTIILYRDEVQTLKEKLQTYNHIDIKTVKEIIIY